MPFNMALAFALLFKVEAEGLLYEVALAANAKLNNKLLIREPEAFYRLVSPLWKGNKREAHPPQEEPEPYRRTSTPVHMQV